MSKYEIRPQVECENRILFECQNTKFGPSSNVKIGFECNNTKLGPSSNGKIGFLMSKYKIRSQFECQNEIFKSNVKIEF